MSSFYHPAECISINRGENDLPHVVQPDHQRELLTASALPRTPKTGYPHQHGRPEDEDASLFSHWVAASTSSTALRRTRRQ